MEPRFLNLLDPSLPLQLHNDYALVLGQNVIRILELETYHTSDPYTHCNERQFACTDQGHNLIPHNDGSLCSFYIHRTGTSANASYKGGSYKGIDIASNGGILIRSICSYASNGQISMIEGPSLVVDHLSSIMENLIGSSENVLASLEHYLQLVAYDWTPKASSENVAGSLPQYIGARAGLSFKDITRAPYFIALQRSSIFQCKK